MYSSFYILSNVLCRELNAILELPSLVTLLLFTACTTNCSLSIVFPSRCPELKFRTTFKLHLLECQLDTHLTEHVQSTRLKFVYVFKYWF